MIDTLFPAAAVLQLNIEREITPTESKLALDLKASLNDLGRFSSNQQVLNEPAMLDIKAFIHKGLKQYMSTVLGASEEIHTTLSWFSYLKEGMQHGEHHHPNSFLSGVFYLDVNPGDLLMFHKNEAHESVKPHYEKETPWNQVVHRCYLKPGDLLIFPSYSKHSVPYVTPGKDRISLAFNAFMSGKIGAEVNYGALQL